jgi:DNA primase
MADTQVEEVKSKTDIVALIGERIQLKKGGRNFKGICPFHGEKSPSFFVSPDMQMYKCFGCGAAGDVFNFLMAYEGLTFPEALNDLAAKAGVTLTKREKTSTEIQHDRVLELLHLAAEYYHYLLTEHKIGREALNYLKKRGISNQTIKDFKLGYSLESWDALQQYLVGKKKYTTEEILAAGLIIKSDRGSYYDRFRGRLMFPLVTYAGKIVGFSGRTLDPEAKEAKYINSPETDMYHKSELLFGVTQAKKTIRDHDRIVIVEGEFDVMSSHQIGLKEVVAIKGSALTADQASLIRRLTHNVILALDADAAGQEAIKRGIGVCEALSLNLRIVRISGGKDPDDLSKTDPHLWKELITSADSVYGYLIDNACEQFDVSTGEGKKKITQAVMPELAKIENAVEREFYIKKLANTLHISESAVSEELGKTKRAIQVGSTGTTTQTKSFNRRELLERQLLGLVLQSRKTSLLLRDVDPRWFSETHLKRLFDAIQKDAKEDMFGAKLVSVLPEAIRPLAEEVFTMHVAWLEESEENLLSLLVETKSKLMEDWSKHHLIELSKEMATLTDDPVKLKAIQYEYKITAEAKKEAEGGRD